VSDNPSSYGLQPPQGTVTLSGKIRRKSDEKKDEERRRARARMESCCWATKARTRNTSTRRHRTIRAECSRLPRSSLNAVFFKSGNDLRSKRLFDFS